MFSAPRERRLRAVRWARKAHCFKPESIAIASFLYQRADGDGDFLAGTKNPHAVLFADRLESRGDGLAFLARRLGMGSRFHVA